MTQISDKQAAGALAQGHPKSPPGVPGKSNLARSGAPKKLADVKVAHGQRSRVAQPSGVRVTDVHGLPDASSPDPLDLEARNPAKQGTVSLTPGMRTRTLGGTVAGCPICEQVHADLGARVLNDAVQRVPKGRKSK